MCEISTTTSDIKLYSKIVQIYWEEVKVFPKPYIKLTRKYFLAFADIFQSSKHFVEFFRWKLWTKIHIFERCV